MEEAIKLIQKIGIGNYYDIGEYHSLQIMSEKEIIETIKYVYPAILVKNEGYFPIGSDLTGGGDEYYIKVTDKPHYKIYQLYHDTITYNEKQNMEYDYKAGVEICLENIEELNKYKR